ncbi:MAG: hypothetical protein EOO41_00175 [Methanobacteriota archaeon]|nr:MAG: hypothetical protein EOO41_00175 [Euryarchaeota archaeon]
MDCASAWLLALTQAACASNDEGGVGAAFPLPPLALPAPDDHATAARSTLAALLVGSRTCPLVLEPHALDLVRLFCAEAADVHRLSADTTAGPASSIAASAASLADESTCQAVQPWSAALADYLEAVARVTHARTDAVQLAVPVLRAATTCLDALSTCVQAAAASTRGSAATPAATHAALSLEGGLASHDRMEEEVDLLRVGVVVKAAADAVRIARALLLCACRALSVTPSHDEVTSTGAGVGACADAGVSAGAGGHGHALPTHGMPSARSTIVAALPSPALEAAAPGIHGALCSLAAAAAVAEEVMSQPVCHEITLRGLTAALAPTTAAAVQAAAAWRTASSSDDMRVCIAAAAHELGFEAWLAALSRVVLFVSDAPSVLSLVQPRDADAHLAVFASGVCLLAAYPQSADAHEAADGAVSRAVYCVRAFGAAQVAAAAASGSQQCPPCAAEATPRAAGEQLLGGVPEIDDSLLLHSVSIVLRGLTASCRAGSRLSARALVDADAAFHALAHITRVAHCHSPLEVGEEVHVHTLECNDDTARCYAWLCALPDDDTLCVADIVAACCDALRSDECALAVAATRAMRTYASVMSLAERALEAETASAALAVADALLQAAGTVLEESVQMHAMQSAAAWSRAVSSSTTTTFDEHTLYKASELVHLVLALVRVPEQADLAVCAAATQGVVTRLVPPSLRMLEAYYEPRGQPPTFVRVSERAKAACEEALLYQFLLLQVCLECATETVVDASEALQDAVSEASKTKGKSKKTPAVAAAELELRGKRLGRTRLCVGACASFVCKNKASRLCVRAPRTHAPAETKRLCTGTLLPALQDIWHALADAMPVLTRVTSHVSVRLNDALRAVLARSEELRDLLPTKAGTHTHLPRPARVACPYPALLTCKHACMHACDAALQTRRSSTSEWWRLAWLLGAPSLLPPPRRRRHPSAASRVHWTQLPARLYHCRLCLTAVRRSQLRSLCAHGVACNLLCHT